MIFFFFLTLRTHPVFLIQSHLQCCSVQWISPWFSSFYTRALNLGWLWLRWERNHNCFIWFVFFFFLLLSQLSLPSFVSRCWAVSVVWSRISLLSSIPNFLSEPRLRVPVFPLSLTLPCYPAGSVPGGAGHGHPDPGHSRAGAGQTQPGAPELGIAWRRSLPFNSTQSLTFIKTAPKFLSCFHIINW